MSKAWRKPSKYPKWCLFIDGQHVASVGRVDKENKWRVWLKDRVGAWRLLLSPIPDDATAKQVKTAAEDALGDLLKEAGEKLAELRKGREHA